MRYALAGDRKISCNILKFLMEKGYRPLALLISDNSRSSHSKELINIAGLKDDLIFTGDTFKEFHNKQILIDLELDYIFGIHFPYIIPKDILDIPTIGFLNLHPAFLPFNKGWHTPTWAIVDKTPYGATLHFMTEALDEGDIVHQKELTISQKDTADALYQKVLNLEEEVFVEAFEQLIAKRPKRISQKEQGTSHNKKDLRAIQEINLKEEKNPLDIIDQLRALTTNNKSEAAYFQVDGKKIGIQVQLFELE